MLTNIHFESSAIADGLKKFPEYDI